LEYKARYRKKGVNPFAPNYRELTGSICSVTTNVPDNTPLKQVRKMAKEATPDGFEFIEVKRVIK